MNDLIALDQVSYSYGSGGPLVIKEVSLVVTGGTSLAVIGPSGSGKSTLLSLLGGIVQPTSGTVEFEGSELRQNSRAGDALRAQTAWVMQTANLFPRLSAVRNVALGAMCRGVASRRSISLAREALLALELSELADTPVRRLSGGQAQRVAVARAMASEAPIIFADEPTGQLDASSTEVMTRAFTRIARSGRTLIIATHDTQVARACGLTLKVSDGRID